MTDAEFSELELVFWRVSQGSLWVDNQVRVGAEQTSKSEKNPSEILILQNLILASHQFELTNPSEICSEHNSVTAER